MVLEIVSKVTPTPGQYQVHTSYIKVPLLSMKLTEYLCPIVIGLL